MNILNFYHHLNTKRLNKRLYGGKLNKIELSIVGGEILIILIYCFTYAALRRFPAVAVRQTLLKVEKQKDTGH